MINAKKPSPWDICLAGGHKTGEAYDGRKKNVCRPMQVPSLFNLVFIRDVSFSAKSGICIFFLPAVTNYIWPSPFLLPEKHLLQS